MTIRPWLFGLLAGLSLATSTPAARAAGVETAGTAHGAYNHHPPDDYEQARRLVDLLYRGALFREADPQGAAGWTDAVMRGGYQGLLQVASGIGSSQEARGVLWQQGPEAWVANLYRQLLFREPDPQGYWGWVNALQRGENPGVILRGFASSQEFYDKNIGYQPD